MLTWDDSMRTGDREIDAQHWEIVEKCNGFADALANDRFGAEDAESMLEFLQFYAGWYFNREEENFAKYQCPAADANREAHADFNRQFGDFCDEWQQEGMDLETIKDAFAAISAWIENHLVRTGSQLRPSVDKRSNQRTQETPTVDP